MAVARPVTAPATAAASAGVAVGKALGAGLQAQASATGEARLQLVLNGAGSATAAASAGISLTKPIGGPALVLATVAGRIVSTYLVEVNAFVGTASDAQQTLIRADVAGSTITATVQPWEITAEVDEVISGATIDAAARAVAEVAPSEITASVDVMYLDFREAA